MIFSNRPKTSSLTYQDLVSEFILASRALRHLADTLGFGNFSQMMTDTLWVLEHPTWDDRTKLRRAYDASRIFGGMGSWNDEPAFVADDMGLNSEYTQASKALDDIRQKVRCMP